MLNKLKVNIYCTVWNNQIIFYKNKHSEFTKTLAPIFLYLPKVLSGWVVEEEAAWGGDNERRHGADRTVAVDGPDDCFISVVLEPDGEDVGVGGGGEGAEAGGEGGVEGGEDALLGGTPWGVGDVEGGEDLLRMGWFWERWEEEDEEEEEEIAAGHG